MHCMPLEKIGNSYRYEKDCEEYAGIIEMFKELGSGNLDRRDVLNNIKTMYENGIIEKLEDIIMKIEMYEAWN